MIRNFIFFLAPSLFQIVVSIFVIVPITTFYLDPYDFGIIALLFAIMAPVSSITSAPDFVLGEYYHQSDKDTQKIIVFNMMCIDFLFRTSILIIFWLLGNKIIIFFELSSYENIYLIYYLVLLGTWLTLFWSTVSKLLIVTGRGKYHFFWDTSKFLVGVFATIISIAYFKLGTISIIIGFVVSNLYSIIFELFYLKNQIILSYSNYWIKKIFTCVYFYVPTTLTAAFQPLAERILIQSYLGLSMLGIYTHAQIYSNAFKLINKSAGHAVTKSSIIGYSGKNKETIQKIEKLLKILFVTLNLTGFLIILFIGDIINFLTHGSFNDAADLVPILYMIIFSHFYGIMPRQCLIVNGKKNILFLSEFIFTIICVCLILLFIQILGLKGVIFAVLISNFFIQLWRRIAVMRLGYSSNIDSYFWVGIFMYLLFYFIIDNLGISFLYKIVISIFIVSIILLTLYKNLETIIEQFSNKSSFN